jgi:hypothetical protein
MASRQRKRSAQGRRPHMIFAAPPKKELVFLNDLARNHRYVRHALLRFQSHKASVSRLRSQSQVLLSRALICVFCKLVDGNAASEYVRVSLRLVFAAACSSTFTVTPLLGIAYSKSVIVAGIVVGGRLGMGPC